MWWTTRASDNWQWLGLVKFKVYELSIVPYMHKSDIWMWDSLNCLLSLSVGTSVYLQQRNCLGYIWIIVSLSPSICLCKCLVSTTPPSLNLSVQNSSLTDEPILMKLYTLTVYNLSTCVWRGIILVWRSSREIIDLSQFDSAGTGFYFCELHTAHTALVDMVLKTQI